MVTDGKIDDWKGIPVTFYQEMNAAIAFANDADHLYIQFRTNDPKWVRAIKMTGITIYVNNRGKKGKRFFVKYTGGPTMEQLKGMVSRDGERSEERSSRMSDRMNQFQDRPNQLTCFVKDRIIEKPIPLDGGEGPAAAFDTSFGFYTYEFRIPLAESTVRDYGINASLGQEISIGAKWGGMGEMKRGGGMGGRSSGGRPGGGGGGGGRMDGRGSGGGRGGGMGRGSFEMPTEQKVWLKTVLALPEDGKSNSK